MAEIVAQATDRHLPLSPRAEEALLDVFRRRVRLEGLLVTETGLHIGAGRSNDPLATDAPVVRDAAGRPFIPGASLKGVLRSAAESLMRSGPNLPSREPWTCDALNGSRQACVDHERLNTRREELEAAHAHALNAREQAMRRGEVLTGQPPTVARQLAEWAWGASCSVCRLFGSLAQASRLRLPDLPLAEDSPPPFELRNGVGIDRDKELAASQVLYDFEAVPPGTTFELVAVLDNVSDAELGLVLYLFQELSDGHLALGGKTSRGLGRVRVEWRRIEETGLDSRAGKAKNPFSRLLSRRELLRSSEEEVAEAVAADDSEPAAEALALPEGGDQETWARLAALLQDLGSAGDGRIDKTALGQEAAKQGVERAKLNEVLALGLEGRRVKKAWDEVLLRFVASGLLEETPEDFWLAGRAPRAPEREAEASVAAVKAENGPQRDPELQRLYDDYVGAMARVWEAACSPDS